MRNSKGLTFVDCIKAVLGLDFKVKLSCFQVKIRGKSVYLKL